MKVNDENCAKLINRIFKDFMTTSKQPLSFVESVAQREGEGLAIEDAAKNILKQKAPTEFHGLAQILYPVRLFEKCIHKM